MGERNKLPKRVFNLKEAAYQMDLTYHILRKLIDSGAIRTVFLPGEKATDVEIDRFVLTITKDGRKYEEMLKENNRRVGAKKPVQSKIISMKG